jgi:hypothetical protein
MNAEHPQNVPTPLTLSDAELVAVGAYVRGDRDGIDEQAQALVTVGLKLTRFFMQVARVAVEHYDREQAASDPTEGAS